MTHGRTLNRELYRVFGALTHEATNCSSWYDALRVCTNICVCRFIINRINYLALTLLFVYDMKDKGLHGALDSEVAQKTSVHVF